MYNDKHNGSVLVQRSRATISTAVIALLSGIWFFGQALISAVSMLSGVEGTLVAEIPLQDADLESMTAEWNPGVDFIVNGSATVGASNVDPGVVADFTLASVVAAIVALATLVLVAWSAVALFGGRLHWNALSTNVIIVGGVVAIGSFIAQSLSTTAAESLATELNVSDGVWMEPGFVSGVSFLPVVVGVAIVIFGWSLRGTGKIAEDSFGVV